VAHVDEVADDEPAQVAETELAADLVDGLDVGLVGVGLGVLGAAAAARVDVDGDEGLGLFDDEPPPEGRGTSVACMSSSWDSMPNAWKMGRFSA
jgi:hypothetical protein